MTSPGLIGFWKCALCPGWRAPGSPDSRAVCVYGLRLIFSKTPHYSGNGNACPCVCRICARFYFHFGWSGTIEWIGFESFREFRILEWVRKSGSWFVCLWSRHRAASHSVVRVDFNLKTVGWTKKWVCTWDHEPDAKLHVQLITKLNLIECIVLANDFSSSKRAVRRNQPSFELSRFSTLQVST